MSAGVNPVYTSGFTPGLTINQRQVPLYNGPVGVPGMNSAGRKQKGKGLIDNIKKGIQFIKDKKVISNGADMISSVAKKHGFGMNDGYNVPKQGPHGFAVDNIAPFEITFLSFTN